MDATNEEEGIDLAAMFAAGAASALDGLGMTEKQAEAFVVGVCKEAASGDVDYDDGGDTFWGRNKGWLLPTIVGALAFKFGAESVKSNTWRPDRGDVGNAIGFLWGKLDTLLGKRRGPLQSAISLPSS